MAEQNTVEFGLTRISSARSINDSGEQASFMVGAWKPRQNPISRFGNVVDLTAGAFDQRPCVGMHSLRTEPLDEG